ncbi:hypothetical protein M407DRAFT_215617, partial [Tulasnella calospora MUT 4182]
MNGVRRFLGGGGISLATRSTSPSDSPSVPSTPQQESMPANTAMIMSPTSATMQGFSSRGGGTMSSADDNGQFARRGHGGGSSSSFALPNSPMSPESPGNTTKALFFRKEGRRQNTVTSMRNWTDDNNNDNNNDYSDRSPTATGRPGGPLTSSSRTHTSQPSSTSFSSSRPPLSSIATTATRFTTDPRASPAVSGTASSLTWRNAHSSVNMKDELLLSLLASQAVVDSKDSEILNAEDVEELKREYSLVASRVSSAARKLSTETRIRDAALKLHNSAGDSKGKAEDFESLSAANRKVELAQQEFQRLSDRANDISKRLLEHRAGVLSFSVKTLEKKAAVLAGAAPHHAADTDSESSHGTGFSNGEMSPASTTATSLSIAHKKFDGAHFFAGHADAITPGMNVSPARVKELEEKLRQADAAVASMKKRHAELMRDLDILGLEKTEVETHMSLELQTAEERVTELEGEVQKVPELEDQVARLEDARRGWEKDKRDLEDRLRMAEERSVAAVAEATGSRNAEAEEAMIQLRAELMAKDSENKRLLDEKRAIEEEKNSLRQSLTEHQAGATQEVIVAREALRAMCRANRVVTPLGETGLLPLIQSLEAHLSTFDQAKEQMMESRERLSAELEEARREREEARKEARAMETRLLKERSDSIDSLSRRTPSPLQPPIRRPSGDAATEYDRIVALLRPIWAILPSVSARASKLGSSSSGRMTPRSPKASNGKSPDSPVMSLSELDVRSLKALYDPRANYTSPTVSGDFSFEEFASRVQALVQDDRALVERLIRFAQAHDLLRTNAERAQKLAQDSSKGLETYQNQVKTLEERNMELATKQTELMDEIEDLHMTMERLEEQKRAMEEQAAEQAETCKQLNEANDALSAKTLTLAAEAAAAAGSAGSGSASSEQMKKLEQQLVEKQKELEDVNDLLDRTRMAESTQRVALLDELNTLQQENNTLRNQLRSR